LASFGCADDKATDRVAYVEVTAARPSDADVVLGSLSMPAQMSRFFADNQQGAFEQELSASGAQSASGRAWESDIGFVRVLKITFATPEGGGKPHRRQRCHRDERRHHL
jgi:hypothetical protein